MCTEASVPHIPMTTACQPQQQEKEGPRWRIRAKGREPTRTTAMHCQPQPTPRAPILTPENCLVPGAVGWRVHGQHNDCKVPRSSDCKNPPNHHSSNSMFDSWHEAFVLRGCVGFPNVSIWSRLSKGNCSCVSLKCTFANKPCCLVLLEGQGFLLAARPNKPHVFSLFLYSHEI